MEMHPKPFSHASPNKRIKTLIATPEAPPRSPSSFISKGKSKIQEETPLAIQKKAENESTDCCGICLSEAGNGEVSRGYIDSCNHYFCFVCIMEWAKVESKCPLCKRRFSTIRRPAKLPIFTSERVVHVPVRDQVYHYFGNATIGPPDPYSEVKCSMCHGVADESLLLLCDLCDSAAHTYCVGLGVTVPEGDWFCHDCTLLKDEHLKSEINIDSGVQISFDTVHKISSANERASIFETVQEPCGHAIHRSRSAASGKCYLPPPSSTDDETSVISNIDRPSSTSQEIVRKHPTKPNTRTLQHCRNLHDRIRVLRENWNGFQNGFLCFSSSPGDGIISSQKSVTCRSGRHSVSCLNQQSTAQCSSSDVTNDIEAHEIQKAWKMMEKAKSIKQSREGSTIVRQASKCPIIRKLNAPKDSDHMSYRHLSPDGHQYGARNVGSTGSGHHHYSIEKGYYKQLSSGSGKQQWRRHMAEDVTSQCEGSITGHYQELKSSKGVQNPSYLYDTSVRSGEKQPKEKSTKRPACLSSLVVPEPVVLNMDHAKGVNHASCSHSKVNHPKEKSKLEKITVDSQQYNDAKSEVQSLVKLNIKLQAKEEILEVDAFKEVARLATHIILAACGLEHPKPGLCSFAIPGFICCHPSEAGQLEKSSLMPNSCRECFYVFVKDIVNTVILQKRTTAGWGEAGD